MRFTVHPEGGQPFTFTISNKVIFSRFVFWLLPRKWRSYLPDGFDYAAYARFSAVLRDAKQRFPDLALFDAVEAGGSRFRINF